MLVSATDLDSTTNGEITYSVNSTNFNMDSATGRLTTSLALDRETTPSFLITICASDQGSTVLSVCEMVSLLFLQFNSICILHCMQRNVSSEIWPCLFVLSRMLLYYIYFVLNTQQISYTNL